MTLLQRIDVSDRGGCPGPRGRVRFGDADRRTYAVHVTSASRSRKPSLLTRFAFDAHGDLRGGRLLAMTAVIAMFISMGTLVVVYLTNEVSPAAMACGSEGRSSS